MTSILDEDEVINRSRESSEESKENNKIYIETITSNIETIRKLTQYQ